jgi:hypothetical protein
MLKALFALQLLTVAAPDPLAFFSPTVAISASDRHRLLSGEPIALVIPAKRTDVAILAAVPVQIDGDRLVDWIRQIEALKKSTYVLAIRRFSDPPRLADLADLTLADDDLSAIRACRPGQCRLKLSAAEMADLQHAASAAQADWKAAVRQRFRQIVMARVNTYLANGRVGPWNDHAQEVWPADAFARLVDESGFLLAHRPQFASALRRNPMPRPPGVEVFLYWSNERLANRPIISVTDVNILRSDEPGVPDVLVAGKEVFSTHYVNASFGLTALVRGDAGGPNYLVYLNRSEVDVLGGPFSSVIRWVIQRRLRAGAATALEGLKKRLEGGEPLVP